MSIDRIAPMGGAGGLYSTRRRLEPGRLSLALGVAAFLLSVLTYPFYTLGDQSHYRLFYGIAGEIPLSQVIEVQNAILSTQEPLYGFVAHFSSPFVRKDLFFSLLNGLLAYSAALFFLRRGAHPFVVACLVLFNFYSYVMYFAAERQKLGLLILLLGLNTTGVRRGLLLVLAPLAHSLVLAIYVAAIGLAASRAAQVVRTFSMMPLRRLLGLLILMTGAALVVLLQSDHLASKWATYEAPDVANLAKAAVFLAASIGIGRDRRGVLCSMLPLFGLIYFLGGQDLNIVAFFLFLRFSVVHNGGLNIPVLAFLIYFGVTGALLLKEIVTYGKGIF